MRADDLVYGIDKDGKFIIAASERDWSEGAKRIVNGIRKIRVDFLPGRMVEAEVLLLADFVRLRTGSYRCFIHDPFTSERKEVTEIRYRDGSILHLD